METPPQGAGLLALKPLSTFWGASRRSRSPAMGPKGVPRPRPTLPSPPGPHQQRAMAMAFAANTPPLQSWPGP